jgi:osmotically-inducible protein OsmY
MWIGGGVVYLSGYVGAGEMRAAAEDVARTAPGVSKVVNTIAVAHWVVSEPT